MIRINSNEQYLSTMIFKLRIHTYEGQQFEDFFVEIMCAYNKNFQPVKAHGRYGDRKNDGFDKYSGTFYQVYAPEEINKKDTINNAVKKLEEDFKELYEYWNSICPIKKYFFVINDKYKGVSALVHEMALELNKRPEYAGTDISIFDASALQRIFYSLDTNSMQNIIGFIPDTYIPQIEYNALNETVNYLMNIECKYDFSENLVNPDFDKKISFNKLSDKTKSLLTVGGYQEGALDHYFDETPGLKDTLQKKFNSLYKESKDIISEDVEDFADSRFFYIAEKSSPRNTQAIKSCVFILMSYYFSCCDIFEEPI